MTVIALALIVGVAVAQRCPQCKKWGAMAEIGWDEIHSETERRYTETVQEKIGSVTTHAGWDTYHTDVYRDKEVQHMNKVLDVTKRFKCACCGYEMTKRANEVIKIQ